MPRLQVYLPDDLCCAVKDRGLPASELLRRAVQAELRRQTLLEEAARYVDELVAEVGPLTTRQWPRPRPSETRSDGPGTQAGRRDATGARLRRRVTPCPTEP
jgi:hypothetical protein